VTARSDTMVRRKPASLMTIRHRLQAAVVFAMFLIGLRHVLPGETSRGGALDFFCPFGGVETLLPLLLRGDTLRTTGLLSLAILVAVVGLSLLAGRAFCGWLCPLGAVQDGLAGAARRLSGEKRHIRGKKSPARFPTRLPAALDRPLRYAKYVILALIVLASITAVYPPLHRFCPVHALFGLRLTPLLWGVLLVFVATSLLVERFSCKYLCPLGALLAVTNRVVAADRAMRRGDWGDDHDERHLGVQLAGKVALLVGYGAIGRALRPSLEALGMEVRAYRRRPRADGSVREYGPGKLHEALAAADAVVVSLPATPDTEGLLGAAELARLKPTAALVNVGRGKVIDEEALYRALAAGRLLGAGIDVWYRYPKREPLERVFPSAYPFQELDNVVMSPHRGNDVRDWQRVAARDVLATLTALAAGEERNRVDLESGY